MSGAECWDIYNGPIVRAGRPFCPRVIITTPSNRPGLLLTLDYSQVIITRLLITLGAIILIALQ